jgi:transketolase
MAMSLHQQELRMVYTETLMELMRENPAIICMEADLGKATGTVPKLRDEFPGRFFNCGIAEANMIGVAAGLANDGMIPFCASFSGFATRRDYDQVTISVAYADNPVKIVGTAPGVTATYNGGTHMCFQDLAIMRAMPNMRVYSPCDAYELRSMLKHMAGTPKPIYLQLIRDKMPQIFDQGYQFDPYQARVLRSGGDLTLVSTGFTTHLAVRAAVELEQQGLMVEHVHYPSIKPFDETSLIESAQKTGAVVTVENQSVIGGLGSAVCETLAAHHPVPVKRLGVANRFGEVGSLEYLIDTMGIGSRHIAAACLAMKKHN